MKCLFSLLLLMLSPSAFAVFGVEPGIYKGSGTLESEAMLVPDLNFESERLISEDGIVAHTKADLFGWVLAEASANLKVVPAGSNGGFVMLDLNDNWRRAGSGRCGDGRCSFEVSVMNGRLILRETWIIRGDSFRVVDASQVFDNRPAKYAGDFVRVFGR